jgi:hypothetical protein
LEVSVAALKNKTSEAEALRVATWNEVSRLRTERGEHVTAIGEIRAQLGLRRQ